MADEPSKTKDVPGKIKDVPGKIKVAWSIGKGKIPNGPDFSNTIGTMDLDSFRYDQITVSKSSVKKFLFDDSIQTATIVLIRAIPDDNGNVDIYKKLSYQFMSTLADATPNVDDVTTDFGESPLMLIGSVAKLVEGYHGIFIRYDPDKSDNDTEGVSKATTPQPPKEATISILIGFRTQTPPEKQT